MDESSKEKFKQFVREKPSNLIPMLKAEEMEEKIKQLIAELEELQKLDNLAAHAVKARGLQLEPIYYANKILDRAKVIERLNSILKGE